MSNTLVRILKQPRYAALAVVTGLFVYCIVAWINNGDFLYVMLTSSTFSLWTKIELILVGLWAVWSIVGIFSYICIIVLSVLFGVYAAVFAYWVQQSKKLQAKEVGRGAWGALLGFIGLGCSVCGTLVITPFLTAVGATAVLSVLPLHGTEFLLLAIAWMVFSVYLLLKKINTPLVCMVD